MVKRVDSSLVVEGRRVAKEAFNQLTKHDNGCYDSKKMLYSSTEGSVRRVPVSV
jgi:hypothetical protein